jgi:hypothetical protein
VILELFAVEVCVERRGGLLVGDQRRQSAELQPNESQFFFDRVAAVVDLAKFG